MLWLSFAFWLCLLPNRHGAQILPEETPSFHAPTLHLKSLQVTLASKLLLDVYSPRSETLKGYLGWLPMNANITYRNCSGANSDPDSICLMYSKDTQLLITHDDVDQHCDEGGMSCPVADCYRIEWANHVGGIMDCILLGEDEWYGGGEMIYQGWPIQGHSRSWFPQVTGDPLHHPSGNVVENIWFSSGGFAIRVDNQVPLYVSFNENGSGRMCFTTSYKKHPYANNTPNKPVLSYSICSAPSIKDAYAFSIRKWIKKPFNVPDETMFQYPIWSTWARYKRQVNESIVLKFAEEIRLADFPVSQIQIDDKWETCYGDLDFDSDRYPNAKQMVEVLAYMDYPTTLWVHPFCNVECKTYQIGQKNNFWVRDVAGNTFHAKWWNGDEAAVLDTTNPKAVEWYVDRLKNLQRKYGVASFKFDAGEVLWLSSDFVLHSPEANLQPNLFSKFYAELAAEFGEKVEVRVGCNTQHLPIFVRMFDKFSRWDYANGLKTLIPNALQLSLMGYNFILPDMIGGNNYDSINSSLPDRELYIRWLEATVFLPVLQFSITPWDYDEEVVAISKSMVDLHKKFSSDLLSLAMKSVTSGEPIIRPLWWISPDDIEALRIDSEFLVGDDILVAPVLEKGKTKRDVYLPDGRWSDPRGKSHTGPQWLYDYNAPLNFVPHFIRHS